MFSGLVALSVAVFGVAVWSVRQEGRINAHDQLFQEREKQETTRFEDVKTRLARIEQKLDSLNGKSH